MKLFPDILDHSKVGIAGWSRGRALVGPDYLGNFDQKDGQEEDDEGQGRGHFRNLFTYV